MARFIRPAMLAILLAFLVDSTISEADKFIGPKLYEATGKSTLLPTSSKTAIALKYEDIPHASASGDNEAKERMELLDFMENMVTNMKFVAKEFDRDGILVVRAVKTTHAMEPPLDIGADDRDTAKSAKPKRKLLPSRNVSTSANESPFKTAVQDQCDKKEPIFQSPDAAD